MNKRELEMYKVEDIVNDLLQNKGIKQIARTRKISKNTVKKYRKFLTLVLENNPKISNNISLIMDVFRRVRKEENYSENFGWLENNKELLEKLICECENYARLVEVLEYKGFKGSYSSLLRYVSKNKINSDKPIVRVETKPGDVAQVDFGYVGKIYDEDKADYIKAYVFVMVLGFSRDAYYEIVRTQDIETWCLCHVHAFEYFNGVPKIIIPDNLKSAIVKVAFCDPIINKSYGDLAKHYSFQVDPCLPSSPQHKGKVESGVKYVKNNFIPLRSMKNFVDANKQLNEWNEKIARVRIHGTTRRMPIELFENHEKHKLTKLPASCFEISVWKKLKVYKDIHIQFDKSYYSVPCELTDEYVFVRKTKSQVAIFYDGKLIAVHVPIYKGGRRTKKEHYPPDKFKYLQYDPDYCLKKANEIGANVLSVVQHMLQDEPIRYLRAAQNIIRMIKKYDGERIDDACQRAIAFGNYSYRGIKQILEKGLDRQEYLLCQEETKKLNSSYARDIREIIKEVYTYGNVSAN